MITINDAIVSLRPNTEWVLVDDDIENIQFLSGDSTPLTRAEVDKEIIRLEKLAKEKELKAIETREAAIAHAKSLGFTDSMISEMFPALQI